jgi:hypothetical protein
LSSYENCLLVPCAGANLPYEVVGASRTADRRTRLKIYLIHGRIVMDLSRERHRWPKSLPRRQNQSCACCIRIIFDLRPQFRLNSYATAQIAEVNFICPHCGSFYEVVRAEALPESFHSLVACPNCTKPLPAREAQFALKYFLFRKASRGWQRLPVGT